MTIDEALKALKKAKKSLGGNAVLALSLADSQLPSVDIDDFFIDKDGGYVEVQATHPDCIDLGK